MAKLLRILLGAALVAGAAFALSQRVGGVPPLGMLLDPWDGLYRSARISQHQAERTISIPALDAPVTIVRDQRGVPHIFASSDKDAIIAMGFVVAQDRLFQMDFIQRAASGRLSEVLGESALPVDRHMRQTGMELGARRNWERIRQEAGIEADMLEWYGAGVNAYLDGLSGEDLPLEFRLLGYTPERYTPMHAMRLLEYMTYDLSYRSDDAEYAMLRQHLSEEDYRQLYPVNASFSVPIVPETADIQNGRDGAYAFPQAPDEAVHTLKGLHAFRQSLLNTFAEGFIEGKGSNNWAVSGARSATGAPVLAGDMHLQLSLPAIWYEVHLVTPTMNVYGVTFPAAPLPVEAYNEQVGWTFTNTGSDQIDHYALTLNEAGTHYRLNNRWRPLEIMPDTIYVGDAKPVVDTLYYSHWGPVVRSDGGAVAVRWMGHEPSRVLKALWGMNHARSYGEFEDAIRFWDSPAQNILYADVYGTIAIRSTGNMPIRKAGHGAGLLDGSSDAFEWIGRIPFEELPHSINPAQGYLASTNQQPADSLYPYYLGHDWREAYRSIRINQLLSAKQQHSVGDIRSYQADVHAVQRVFFVPLLAELTGLSERADSLRTMLLAWDGWTDVDRTEPLILMEFLQALKTLTWDEPVFAEVSDPGETVLYGLLRDRPDAKWLDVQATPQREDATALLRMALEETAERMPAYGPKPSDWRWGDHHKVIFRHLTRSEALGALWRGPFEYPGFDNTLSPARDLVTTHSASWRVVVDFSQRPPRGQGIYPGGQSGDPFSPLYDLHLEDYVAFNYYPLLKPASPDELAAEQQASRIVLQPGAN